MEAWSPEKAIAMEERHIVEGEMRVARQEVLVAMLIENGHRRRLTLAEDLLSTFCKSLEISRERLLYLRTQYGNPSHARPQSSDMQTETLPARGAGRAAGWPHAGSDTSRGTA